MGFEYFQDGIWKIDLALFRYYGLGQAFQVALKQRPKTEPGEGVSFTYGETPLAAMDRILTLCEATSEDTFLELGCGTGRFCMVAARRRGLQATGIEQIPSFVDNAQRIARRLSLTDCRFVHDDLFAQSWSDHSLLYITPTTFTDAGLARFYAKCHELRPGARIASLTHPAKGPGLVPMAMDVLDFSWGAATVFVYRKETSAH